MKDSMLAQGLGCEGMGRSGKSYHQIDTIRYDWTLATVTHQHTGTSNTRQPLLAAPLFNLFTAKA
jgi:hypothetical protein